MHANGVSSAFWSMRTMEPPEPGRVAGVRLARSGAEDGASRPLRAGFVVARANPGGRAPGVPDFLEPTQIPLPLHHSLPGGKHANQPERVDEGQRQAGDVFGGLRAIE